MSRPDRLNRALLFLLGLLFAVGGGYGLLRSFGAFGDDAADEVIVQFGAQDFLVDNDWWLLLVGAAVAIVLCLLGLSWLRALLAPTPALSALPVPAEPGAGVTRVQASAIAQALEADLARDPEVRSAKARLLDDQPLEVDLDVELLDGADVGEVRNRLDRTALANLKQALQTDTVESHVHFRLAEPAGRSLR